MSIKGYSADAQLSRLTQTLATVEPTKPQQNAVSVQAYQFVQQVSTDSSEAGSTTSVIVATGHAALRGDTIRFTSGTFSGREVKVADTTTDTITIAEDLSAELGSGIGFAILRNRSPLINSSGEIITTAGGGGGGGGGVIEIQLDGVATDVARDTLTPANNVSLPTLLLNSSGTEIATASAPLRVDPTGSTTQPVSISAALPAGSNNIGDVDVLSLPSLPAGSNNIGDVDVLSLPSLPAGTNNIGDVDVLSLPALPAGSNNIGDVDVTNFPATVTTDAGNSDASTLRVVIASDQTAIPVTGGGGGGSLDVVDFLDTPVLIASSSNIPASASSTLEVVATLAADVSAIRVNDTTGAFIGVYEGAGNGTLKCIIGPGMDGQIDVSLSSGGRISIRNMANAVINAGSLCIQFYG